MLSEDSIVLEDRLLQDAPTDCAGCRATRRGLFTPYRRFMLSSGTMVAGANAAVLGLGFVLTLAGHPEVGRGLFLTSALVGGWPIVKGAVTATIRRFDLTADLMVSIAMLAALVVGAYSAAALVALMMLLGERLEDLTAARADNALKELAGLVPERVTLRRGGEDVDVPIEGLRPGDIVLVRPGGRVPADGEVVRGQAVANQASLTGESLPLDKGPGDRVYAGTLCAEGALEIRVQEVGPDTTLGHMIRLVREARATQAPVQRLANHYAQYLLPAALTIAVITYLLTGQILRAITVLIVICPCALVLATPTALVAAIANAARRGVLVKHGTAMEQIGRVDVVAFDKTRTLTLGEPEVTQIVCFDGAALSEQELLGLAAAAERSSEHPLARAILAAAHRAGLPVDVPEEFAAMAGHGVRARVRGREIVVGDRMLAARHIATPEDAQARMRSFETHGHKAIPIAVDGAVAGLLVVADAVRPESQAAIERLKALGVRETVLISGDSAAVARAVGRTLGVDRVQAGALPQDKLDLIRELQARGLRVAFVGDGVNDAPALAAADVGIAMGAIGTAVALETADIVLLTDDLGRVPDLIQLARGSLTTIRNNVIFSMGVNLLAVVLGGLGLIGPVLGAIMHEASALPVVANSARLAGWGPRRAG